MKVLIVSATKAEINPLLNTLSSYTQEHAGHFFLKENKQIDVLITGVGSVATAFHLGRKKDLDTYDLVINAGIAGAIDESLLLGSTVQVVRDMFADLGSEDVDGSLLSLSSLELGDEKIGAKPLILENLQPVNGITVNKVHGSAESIIRLRKQLPDAQLESMEGAAFFYACNESGVKKYCQIRAISNYVEPRDRNNWKIADAIANLCENLVKILEIG